jgi:exonuclease SbcC
VAEAEAAAAATGARARAYSAELDAERARSDLAHAEKLVAEAEALHRQLSEVAEEARHLTRLGELLQAFRNALVGTVGPRLEAQAGALFAELTDHEYDQLVVDPETYEIKIVDAGRGHGMDRFSGSETDLANLALRIAISEHVRFQSGGQVGLLVLDEVFGSLDDDRRMRMLSALEHLKGRFRQILVITHSNDVKEQLPQAIEVAKLGERRATARALV